MQNCLRFLLQEELLEYMVKQYMEATWNHTGPVQLYGSFMAPNYPTMLRDWPQPTCVYVAHQR